jgi:alcohol dehydrogenase
VSLVAEERTQKGSYIGSCVPRRDLPNFVGLFQAGRLPVDKLLTHRLRLDEINEGFDRLREGVGVRQVVMFD